MIPETIVGIQRINKALAWDYSISPRVLRNKFVETRKLLDSIATSGIAGQIRIASDLLEDLRSFVWLLKQNKAHGQNLPIIDPTVLDRHGSRCIIRWQGRKRTLYEVVGLQDYPYLLPEYVLNRLAEYANMADRIEIWVPIQPGVCRALFVMRIGVYHLLITDMHYDNPTIRQQVIRHLVYKMTPVIEMQYALASIREGRR